MEGTVPQHPEVPGDTLRTRSGGVLDGAAGTPRPVEPTRQPAALARPLASKPFPPIRRFRPALSDASRPGAGSVRGGEHRGPYLQFWRSVIERRASSSLPRIEQLAAPAKVGQSTTTRTVSEDLLSALTAAYREAASGHVRLAHPEEATQAGGPR